ncbi:MAG: hypothetical protein EXR72_14905 [Myxococcales bacterium]|nr:hypothetical protein [Myxococcales bacterium]
MSGPWSVPLSIATLVAVAGCGASTLPGSDAKVTLDGPSGLADGGNPGDAAGDLTVGTPCGAGLCAAGELCEFGACHKHCGMAARCSDPEACCMPGDVCYLGQCTTPGMPCAPGGGGDGGSCNFTLCPDGQYCEQSIGKCLPLAKTNMCEFHPPVGQFSPKVKWEWQDSKVLPTYNQIMMTPVVADLDGNCMPDVVFSTFAQSNYSTDGVVRAVRGDGKGELWNVTDPALRVGPGAQLALADVDGDGRVEVFACHESKAVLALNSDGSKKWLSADKPCGGYDAPSVADLNHDGIPEVVVGFAVHNAQNGALIGNPPVVKTYGNYGVYSTVAELDGDMQNGMEIVGGGAVYRMDGKLYWDKSGGDLGYPAVADLDGDGHPDVVSVVPAKNVVYAYKSDGTLIWGPKDVNNGVATPKGPTGGGPPTIADFDGDGKPDVATAGGYGYLVLNGQTGKVLWHSTMTTDTSSRVTGSSVFDFEGDGLAEAVYNDERNLRVYDGKTGKVLVKLCSTSGTLWENPIVVDVDADDHAEIVVMNNNYGINMCDQDLGGGMSHSGFKVIGDAQDRWVRTRRIWNQHAYHVTNVGDDARVPKVEPSNWGQPGLNNFRQNVQTKNVFAAPDLVPKDLHALYDQCLKNVITLVATVLNQGAASAPPGVPVTFFWAGPNGTVAVGTTKTKGQILAGASETVSYEWTVQGVDPQGPLTVWVVVDAAGQGPQSGIVNECDEQNNTAKPIQVGCPAIG